MKLIVAVVLLVALALVKIFSIDVDAGGYKDSFRTPDKIEHALVAMSLTFFVAMLCADAAFAFWCVVITGILYEIAQKPWSMPVGEMWAISWRDIVADAFGAFLTWGGIRLLLWLI